MRLFLINFNVLHMSCPSPPAYICSYLVSHVLTFINIYKRTHLDGASLSIQVDKHSSGCSRSRRLLSAAYKNSHFIAHHSFDQLSRSSLKFALVSTLLSSPVRSGFALAQLDSSPFSCSAKLANRKCLCNFSLAFNLHHK